MQVFSLNSAVAGAVLVLALAAGPSAQGAGDAAPAASESSTTTQGATDADASSQQAAPSNIITQEGLRVRYDVSPVAGTLASGEITEADQAEVRFTVTDAQSGQPVSGLYPVVWMDIAEAFNALHGKGGQTLSCRERVGVYLQGLVGVRPLIDLNSYFVMVLNQDPSITVIDPIIGIQGRTNMYAQIILKRAGADWAKTDDEKRMFVSMPVADMVAVVDLDRFAVTHNISAGDNPQRVVLQNDEQYLWVGNDSRTLRDSGVTVLDAQDLKRVKFIATGDGHHEIALSSNDRYAFVSNRESGTVTVIDVQKLEKVKDLELGPKPIAIGYSGLSDALYVADADSGEIVVVDGATLEILARIPTKPGLGPLRVSNDGRWAVAVNPSANQAYVIDTATNRLLHTIAIDDRPFQVAFSDAFAYIRSLDSKWVRMINLAQLGKAADPIITRFEAGKAAPGRVHNLPIADMMVSAPGEASMLVTSPADLTVYYYMEGMNAPMGNFRNYGNAPRAVNVVDRTLKERQPGVYSAKVKIPAAGTYDVVFLLDSPRLLHCFETVAVPNPLLERKLPPLAIEYLNKDRRIKLGETATVRFRLTEPATQQPRADLKGVTVLYYSGSGQQRTEVVARHVGDGIYEVDITPRRPEAYYVYVAAPSLDVNYRDLKYFSLIAVRPKRTAPSGTGGKGGEQRSMRDKTRS